FAVVPRVTGLDAFWAKKLADQQGQPLPTPTYAPIELPQSTPTGFIAAFFAVITGFALIWHIWWLAVIGALGAFVTFLAFAFRTKEEFEVSAETLAQFDRDHPTRSVS